jgi:hypothetical protein
MRFRLAAVAATALPETAIGFASFFLAAAGAGDLPRGVLLLAAGLAGLASLDLARAFGRAAAGFRAGEAFLLFFPGNARFM